LVCLYLVMVAHAVSRYQLPLVTHDFAYAAIYVGMAVTFSCVILLAGLIVAPALGIAVTAEWLLNGFLISIASSLFFLWAVPQMHRTADRVMAQTYLRHRKNQLLQLKALGHRIVRLGTEQEIFESTVSEIARVFDLQAAAAYSRTEFDRDYQLRAAHGWLECPAEVPIDSVLTHMMHGHVGPVLIDGSEMEFNGGMLADLERLRMKLPMEAVFPIASDDFVSGILLLGARQSGERYTEAELALLESTCLQVAVTLRARQLERRASQTEKLISLGTLAAGLAHELRNPLTSVQTFTALLKERLPDPEMLQEFGAVVERDVANILRDKKAEKRDHRRIGSLHVMIEVTDDGPTELAGTIGEREHNARRCRHPRSEDDLSQLASDLADVVAALPDELRDLAERLKTQSISEIAREVGIPRTTVNDTVRRLRQRFEHAGLREYL